MLIDLSGKSADHAGIFVFEKTPHRARENQDWLAGMAEDERLHIAAKFMAKVPVIFALHVPRNCN